MLIFLPYKEEKKYDDHYVEYKVLAVVGWLVGNDVMWPFFTAFFIFDLLPFMMMMMIAHVHFLSL